MPWVWKDPGMDLAIDGVLEFFILIFCCFVRCYLVHPSLFLTYDNLSWHLFIGWGQKHPCFCHVFAPNRIYWTLEMFYGGRGK
jgi:hypothetical protein